MADTGSDIAHTSGPPVEPSPTRRAHTYSRLTTAIAVLALATAGYALLRLDATRDRLDRVNDTARILEADRSVLRAELKNHTTRERTTTRELDRRLDTLDEVPKQLQDLASSVEELRGRAEGPERAWSRAEAMFLLDLAQRRLTLDRDLETTIVALESADTRLASLRDQTFAPVRQQIARELQALRAVRAPDTTGIIARLASSEERALQAPVKGIIAAERAAFDRSTLPEGMLPRAWSIARSTFANLIVVRDVDNGAGSVITAEEALLRRQHLQLLLFSARTAVARHDAAGYRSALATARQWLGEFFDLSSPATQALLGEIQALEPIEIDPPLPDISGSARALRRMMPARRGPE
jgi:uroporphyrin-III C-methyltransferase